MLCRYDTDTPGIERRRTSRHPLLSAESLETILTKKFVDLWDKQITHAMRLFDLLDCICLQISNRHRVINIYDILGIQHDGLRQALNRNLLIGHVSAKHIYLFCTVFVI